MVEILVVRFAYALDMSKRRVGYIDCVGNMRTIYWCKILKTVLIVGVHEIWFRYWCDIAEVLVRFGQYISFICIAYCEI